MSATPFVAAQAQDAERVSQSDEDDAAVQETVIVTGSRIQRANITSASPVAQVSSEQFQIQGATRVEDLINDLPQVFAAQNASVVNGASGTSTLNLRGLGAQRTLVLLDGKRLPFGSPTSSPANVDLIPTQLLERVDIVTGGASAVYGADAVGGVANFVLRRDFEGFGADLQLGAFQDSNDNDFLQNVTAAAGVPSSSGGGFDGRDINLALYAGANSSDGRGNVTAYLSYQNANNVSQADRDISACAIGASTGPDSFEGIGCIGSSSFRRTFSGGDFFQEEDGTLVDFVGGPDQTFNFGPANDFRRANERFNFTTLARYEVTDFAEAYVDFSYVNNQTDATIAPSATFFRAFTVNCANPFLDTGLGPNGDGLGTFSSLLGCETPDAAGVLPESVPFIGGRRNVEGGNRNSDITLETFRTVGGFRGDINDNFSYDIFGQFARTSTTEISTNDLSFVNVQDAFNVVLDANGNPVCESGNANCVPLDIFTRGPNGESFVTDEALDFIQQDGFINGTVQQIVFGGTITGDLTEYGFKSPFAEDGIATVVGWEWRRDELESSPDAISQIPGGMGFTGVGGGTLPVSGEVQVYDLFGEIQAPLVQNQPYIQELTFTGAYRFSDYTTDGNDIENDFTSNTFALGLSWKPVDDVRLRGQFQRAIRAPNVIDLFTGQNTGLFAPTAGANGLFDPCAGDFDPATPTPAPTASAAACANTGVTAAQFGTIPDNPAGQLNSITGGNPLLDVEESDTFTIGAVIQPRWVPGLTVSLDYFDISIDDAIGTVPPETAIDQCLLTGEATFCDLITRDSAGSLFLLNGNGEGVLAANVNIGSLETNGIDLQVNYNFDIPSYGGLALGSVALDYASTYIFNVDSTPVPGLDVVNECVGEFGGQCGVPNPEYRHRFLATWQTPWDLNVTTTWRFSSDVELFGGNGEGPLQGGLGAESFFDLAATYSLTENVTFRTGVNNVFDNDPPLTTSGANGNTFPGTFDSLGRFFFMGVNLQF